MAVDTNELQTTPLHQTHVELGAKMVPFAGYQMPVQYPAGIMKEHLHTRENAGLFDVSHMGQVVVTGANVASQLELLCTADLQNLAVDRQVYSLLTNDTGGIRDDLIITRWDENSFFLVVNAACKQSDIQHLRDNLNGLDITEMQSQGLVALQGPAARSVLSELCPAVANLTFMSGVRADLAGASCYITCSGYTGEDGYEISFPPESASAISAALLANDKVWPIGLGARDSLRLEAGLCLYGHDMNETTTPVEASLNWAIAKSRRQTASFPGADTILRQLAEGAPRKRVGLKVNAKVPVREGAQIQNAAGETVGHVTSGGFSPCLQAPIAMAYVDSTLAAVGTGLTAVVRNKPVAVEVCKTPFVPQRYQR